MSKICCEYGRKQDYESEKWLENMVRKQPKFEKTLEWWFKGSLWKAQVFWLEFLGDDR
jgi:hypothetical protein